MCCDNFFNHTKSCKIEISRNVGVCKERVEAREESMEEGVITVDSTVEPVNRDVLMGTCKSDIVKGVVVE